MSKFRPHVVHFSGHSGEHLIVFEDERDEPHQDVIVTAEAFARAIEATDDLVAQVVPFAIGMADSVDDGDAIADAARFHASVANGQSIRSSHLAGRAAPRAGGSRRS